MQAGPDTAAERWDQRTLPQIIDHILHRYHDALRRDLPGLVAAAKKVEQVHADKHSCPRGLAQLLGHFEHAVYDHLAKEEQVLFPAILGGRMGAYVQMPIRVMLREHEDHDVTLGQIRQLTGDLVPPAEACTTWRGLYAGLATLESELREHIRIENEVLFPRALAT